MSFDNLTTTLRDKSNKEKEVDGRSKTNVKFRISMMMP